ncbi:TetR/AcrR family transcriptional regulator [Streptomyces sp. NPDC059649]|uniref:TetR/AcrR family transcriptional regulator n=1 Tax=Streptomyces sp. NPDC059649 TaxID=3346895 RepID=UPI0036D05189
MTTLFKHFPCKESLDFDQDADLARELIAAVRDRTSGQSIPQALREHVMTAARPHALAAAARASDLRFSASARMVEDTPALRDYAHRMWMRHETAVARAIAEETGVAEDDATCAALAHFALQPPTLPAIRRPAPRRGADLHAPRTRLGSHAPWGLIHPRVAPTRPT